MRFSIEVGHHKFLIKFQIPKQTTTRYLPLQLSVLREHGRCGHVTQVEFVAHDNAHDGGIAEAALVKGRLVYNLVGGGGPRSKNK